MERDTARIEMGDVKNMGIKEAWRALVGGEKKPRGLFYDYLGGWGGSSDDSTFGNSPRGWMQAVKSNVWAKNCVNARASAIAQVPLKLYRGVGEDKEEVLKHPALDLLSEVNPLNLNKSLLRKQTAQQRAIFGECFWLKVRPAPGQPPRELYVLAANDVEILPDANVWVKGYQWLPTGAVYGPDDVIRFYYPSFDGTPRAESPTATALNPINRYNLADVSQASIDARGGQGGGIVFYPDMVDQKTFDEMRHDWDAKRNNPKNAGRDMHVLGAVDYKAGAFAAREMQREERAARLAKEIMAAYQVPPAAAGDYSDASVLANAAVQSRMFWELWAMDELRDMEETLNFDLLWLEYAGAREQGLYFEHDLGEVAALRENDADKVNRAAVAFQSGLLTANEARMEIGQKKVTGEDAALADKLIIAIDGQTSNERAKADAASPVYDSSRLSAKAGELRMTNDELGIVHPRPLPEGGGLMPIVDFVGMEALDAEGNALGAIEAIKRFGEWDGLTATKAAPLVIVGGRAHKASDVRVAVEVE